MFIAPRSRRKTIPLRMIIPNLLTTVALGSGMASIHFSLQSPGEWDRALMAVGVAVVFDALDGRAARLLRASSPFGAVMDSLSDFLAFGIAPGILLYQWMLRYEPVWGLAAIMAFVLCSALRLARFTANVKPSTRPGAKPSPIATRYFVGMPTPSAAAAVLIPPMLANSRHYGTQISGWIQPWMVVLFTFFIAGLMISRIPMFSFKKIRVRRRLIAPLLVAVGLAVVLAARDLWLALALTSLVYIFTLPAAIWTHRRMAAQAALEAHAGPENTAADNAGLRPPLP
ncbi:MAG: phosphatidylcholine/phosphatidylserine synthase [Phycisphaerales bacterium]